MKIVDDYFFLSSFCWNLIECETLSILLQTSRYFAMKTTSQLLKKKKQFKQLSMNSYNLSLGGSKKRKLLFFFIRTAQRVQTKSNSNKA